MNVFDPASPPAADIRDLFHLVLGITGGILVVVMGMLLYCIGRFRARRGDTTEPPQIYGSQPIEVAWTVAPLLTVFVLFLVMVRSSEAVRQPVIPDDAKPLRVTVIGRQWWWEFRYDRYGERSLGFVTANELHVPVGQPVVLDLQSADVVHSFWVPRLTGKTDLIPGRVNQTWFTKVAAGTYLGQCAEYCGTQHANMLLRVVADEPATFDAWLADQAKPAVEAPAMAAAKRQFLSLNCINCHTIRGTPAQGTKGPDLTHLMSRSTLASGMVPNDRAHLYDWVNDPSGPEKIKPGCLMPSLGLDKKQVALVVDYLETLK
jgi:cytochrome c oxidase subunit 2